jgi:hypothetical protein
MNCNKIACRWHVPSAEEHCGAPSLNDMEKVNCPFLAIKVDASDLIAAAKLALQKCPFPVGAQKAKAALEAAIGKATTGIVISRTRAVCNQAAEIEALRNFIGKWRDIIMGGDRFETLESWAKGFVTEAGEVLHEK